MKPQNLFHVCHKWSPPILWDGKIFPSGSRDQDLEWMRENENTFSHGAKGKHSHDSQGVPNKFGVLNFLQIQPL